MMIHVYSVFRFQLCTKIETNSANCSEFVQRVGQLKIEGNGQSLIERCQLCSEVSISIV